MIVFLEDDESIRELVLYALEKAKLDAIAFATVSEFEDYIYVNQADIILLDIMLPKKSGLEILKELKRHSKTHDIPVIMLTAKSQEYDKLIGLDGGADDYITKPFSVMELISRINAVLRRYKKTSTLQYANVKIYDDKHLVTVDDRGVTLTLKEYELLKLLLQNKNIVMSRNALLNSVWGYNFDGETRTVDVHIRSLRTKLKSASQLIKTVRGVGYVIGGGNDAEEDK